MAAGDLAQLLAYLQQLNAEQADLAFPINVESFSEVGRPVAEELGRFVGRVAQLLGELDEIINRMGQNEARSVLHIKQLTTLIDQQGTDLAELSSNVDELSQGVTRVAEDAHQAAAVTNQMNEVGGQSLASLSGVLATVQGLADDATAAQARVAELVAQSQAAARGLREIRGVAATSQLLSLNAAIQSAHARDAAFAVVAQEMRQLSDKTANLVKGIEEQITVMEEVAVGAQAAMETMAAGAANTGTAAGEATSGLDQIQGLIGSVAIAVESIAAVAEEQAAGTEAIAGHTNTLSGAVSTAGTSLRAAYGAAISDLTEQAHSALGQFKINSRTDQMRALVESMAQRVEAAVEAAVAKGEVGLEQLWDTNYVEIKGHEVQRLSRLFNVAKAPQTGFQPPKYYTAYDERIDLPLIEIMDDANRQVKLVFSTVLDLNGFMLAQPRSLMRDWTGDETYDLRHNRIKRRVTDPISTKACRFDLPSSLQTRPLVTKADLAGFTTRPSSRPFLLQTYALDTGDVVLALAMPTYIQGRRWGVVRIGYSPE